MVQARIVLWIMLFFSIMCNIFLTNNINIAMVSMVKFSQSTAQESVCHNNVTVSVHHNQKNMSSNNLNEKFEWSKDDQNMILGAFYVFPWISQFFGGVLSHKYGTKIVVGLSTLIGSVISSVIPMLSHIDPKLVMAVRALQGLIGSIAFPAGLYTIIGQWCPPHERGKFMTVFLGTSIGISLGYPIFGFISETIGWEYIFHFTSLTGIIWYVGWQFLVYDVPEDHPRISNEEKEYIKSYLGRSAARQNLSVPWMAILTSMPFLINIICQFGIIWGRFTLNIYMPMYFRAVHGLDSRENGLITGIPFLFKSVLSYSSGLIADLLLKRDLMSKTNIRKISTFVSSVIAGLILLGVSYSNCNSNAAMICMSLCIIFNACYMTGSSVAIIDMSPNFCSILQGVCGTVCMLSGFISPAVVTLLTRFYHNDPLELWKMVWLITAAMYVIPGIIFVMFSNSELQPWNAITKTKKEEMILKKNSKN